MLGEDWIGTPDAILDVVSAAGYAGVEFSNTMIGDYFESPDRFATALEKRGLACAGFGYAPSGFTNADDFERDRDGALQAIEFCSALAAPLCLGGAASPSRRRYDAKLAQALRFYRDVAERGAAAGVTVCVHPHSHHGSLIESEAEYDAVLSATADSGLMFNPDVGHIVRGGQDPMVCLTRYRNRIAHVHIKDVDADGNWQPLGGGGIEWRPLFDYLSQTQYTGWIVAEEESDAARTAPEAAVGGNREYLASVGL